MPLRENQFRLTTTSVRERCRPPTPGEVNGRGKPLTQKIYWDTDLKGFGVVVGRTSKSFVVQKEVRGRTRRVTIGRFGAWTADQARKRAREFVVEMDRGSDPNARKRAEASRGLTLAEAIEMHVTTMRARKRVERSMQMVRGELGLHLGDWMRRPLAEIRRNDCAVRHECITTERGPYIANRVFRLFRACYNTAMRRIEDLPANPTVGVTFNTERRRGEPIPWGELPTWRRKVDGIANPVRRDLQLFVLFTGLRSTDAKTVRWDQVNFDAGTIHRPTPKGGIDRAFTVPLCGFILDLLRARRLHNRLIFPDDEGWAFPSRDARGRVTHVQTVREQRYQKSRKVDYLPSPHRLRDTFASAAHEARLHPLDLKVLMNHRLPGNTDVTEGYVRPSIDHLKKSVECVAGFLLERMQEVEGTRTSAAK